MAEHTWAGFEEISHNPVVRFVNFRMSIVVINNQDQVQCATFVGQKRDGIKILQYSQVVKYVYIYCDGCLSSLLVKIYSLGL